MVLYFCNMLSLTILSFNYWVKAYEGFYNKSLDLALVKRPLPAFCWNLTGI